MFALVKHPLVDCDFEEAALGYALHNPDLAERFIDVAESALREIVKGPLLYRTRVDNIRRMNLRGFPYSLYFFIETETVYVIALLHGARDHGAVLSRRRLAQG